MDVSTIGKEAVAVTTTTCGATVFSDTVFSGDVIIGVGLNT